MIQIHRLQNAVSILRLVSCCADEGVDNHWTNGLGGFGEERIETEDGGRHGVRSVVCCNIRVHKIAERQTEQAKRALRHRAVEYHEECNRHCRVFVEEVVDKQRYCRLEKERAPT